MSINDLSFTLQWWLTLLLIGVIFLPITTFFLNRFFDKGYIFAKIIGMIAISYVILVLGIFHLTPFTNISLDGLLGIFAISNVFFLLRRKDIGKSLFSSVKIFVAEELLFLAGLLWWTSIRAHQPDIQGLEKYMDFGFVNSILRTKYFPPLDMWYPPFPINYYYFGHLVTAMLTKLSGIKPNISFNLMIATLFSLTLSASFSLGSNLLFFFFEQSGQKKSSGTLSIKNKVLLFIAGSLSAFITTLGGNLHTVYAFFKAYDVENPVPFWKLAFQPQLFPNGYWYPNATRFIYHTIHEFPLYSFVVSDLHGHVLDIPFVLLTIAVLITLFLNRTKPIHILWILITGFLLAIMYMTNAWDGIIYMLLAGLIFFVNLSPKEPINLDNLFSKKNIFRTGYYSLLTFVSFIVFSLPFSVFFKPFASKIGILCAIPVLTNLGHLGPFLFEPDHCQHSPLYQLLILHGFFLFWVIGFCVFLYFQYKKQKHTPIDGMITLLGALSVILIIIPEFVYLKDIYPAHYRANTMFKLVYQSFLMMGISSGYIIVRFFMIRNKNIPFVLYKIFGVFLLLFVAIYPYFAINSYYNNLQTYNGLDGTAYLNKTYPHDYLAINWINAHITGQPVILEAQGDSYTDYARVSANTGLPTVLGWTVHEWLWRGSYDPLPSRIDDIQKLYETDDLGITKGLIKKYKVSLVFVGDLEKKKYTNLDQEKFLKVGKIIYTDNYTTIYQITL